MRGAQITIRCDCGDVGYAAYGERWVCPRCGRAWNTAQIPAEEYWGVMRDQRRDRHHDRQHRAEHREPHPALVPHDPPVLIRRDLGGVPGAAAPGADPALAVRGVADIAAVAADGDQGTAHAGIVDLRGWSEQMAGNRPARATRNPGLAGQRAVAG